MHRGVLLHDFIRAGPLGECRAEIADADAEEPQEHHEHHTHVAPRVPLRPPLVPLRRCEHCRFSLLPRAEARILTVAPAPLTRLSLMHSSG